MTTEPEAIPADALEPCPFCGSHVSIKGDAELCAIVCEDGACTGSGLMSVFEPKDRAAAINTWNTRASRAPVDGAGWRPIETAPKDGTRFLALEGNRHFDCWMACDPRDGCYWMDEADTEPDPTHWMPLPAAPGTHPAPASPDAELVKALSDLVTAVGNMRVPENVADVALLVMVTLGPALSHAQDVLSKHEGDRS